LPQALHLRPDLEPQAIVDSNYGKGDAQGCREFFLEKGVKKIPHFGRNVGSRFHGTTYVSATFLQHRAMLLQYLDLKEGKWFVSLCKWLGSKMGEVFLCVGTVLHASWGRRFFKEVKAEDMSVKDAQTWVGKMLVELQGYEADPKEALKCCGRGMDVVMASNHMDIIEAKLKGIFARMARRFTLYTTSYRDGGSCDYTSAPSGSIKVIHYAPPSLRTTFSAPNA
jgi:hypothetical protein